MDLLQRLSIRSDCDSRDAVFTIEAQAATIRRLTAERDARRADVERWQFTREWLVRHGLLTALQCQPEAGMKVGYYWVLHAPAIINGGSCDGYGKTEEEAIDAARAALAPDGAGEETPAQATAERQEESAP